jgi:hypothetical protein
MITPQITIDYLTLDDDDGNIYNGTPHRDEICAGFNAHNMDCPELHLIEFIYPNGHPDLIDPAGGTIIDVEVVFSIQNPQPGTGMLHFNDGSGWVAIDMQVVSPNVYQAVFPAVDCGIEVLYYFGAQTDQGETVTDPLDAPISTYARYSAAAFTTLMEDNFEDDLGWTVENWWLSDGAWERAVPIPHSVCEMGNPPADFDGSGYCYVTDNSSANQCSSDVDDGLTYLISPTLPDLSGEIIRLSYALWYTNFWGSNPNEKFCRVYFSTNNGANWFLGLEYGPETQAGWMEEKVFLNRYIEPNDQVKVRFEVSDSIGVESIVEAGLDAFKVEKIECGPVSVPGEISVAAQPREFALMGAYPNPFNARVTIKYALPEDSHVTLEIFDLLGRKIETAMDDFQPAGYRSVTWDAEDRSTGIYFYKISMGDFKDTRKIMLLK